MEIASLQMTWLANEDVLQQNTKCGATVMVTSVLEKIDHSDFSGTCEVEFQDVT